MLSGFCSAWRAAKATIDGGVFKGIYFGPVVRLRINFMISYQRVLRQEK
jgi:hypothetical protein